MMRSVFLAGVLMVNSSLFAASFDCTKAVEPMEKTICSHKELSQADEMMGKFYFSIRQGLGTSAKEDFKKSHRTWLKDRKTQCAETDGDCLLNYYQKHIESLRSQEAKLTKTFENLVGDYVINAEDDCGLAIKVFKEKSVYRYTLETTQRAATDTLTLTIEGDDVYLEFNGLMGDDPRVTLQGYLMGKTIVIQNYGNEMNEFTRLSECWEKFLEAEKE